MLATTTIFLTQELTVNSRRIDEFHKILSITITRVPTFSLYFKLWAA